MVRNADSWRWVELLEPSSRGVKRSRSPDEFGDAGPPAGEDGMLCLSLCTSGFFDRVHIPALHIFLGRVTRRR